MDSIYSDNLTEDQYQVLVEKGTEAPFSGKYVNHDEAGTYSCVACGQQLFSSETKFDAHCGWPSFNNVMDKKAVILSEDRTHGMKRVEVVCSKCGGHLGHVFNDAPEQPTGLRFCINSVSLDFQKKTK